MQFTLNWQNQNFLHLFTGKLFWTGKKHVAMITHIHSCILPEYLWHNGITEVDKPSVNFLKVSKKSITYALQLFCDNGSIKQWHEFKREYDLHESSCFKWLQWIDVNSNGFQKDVNLLSKKTIKMIPIL